MWCGRRDVLGCEGEGCGVAGDMCGGVMGRGCGVSGEMCGVAGYGFLVLEGNSHVK